jgi:ketosteroid isomerase-like protein
LRRPIPDVEVSWTAATPDWRVHRGHAGLLQAYTEFLGAWDEFYFDPREFIDAGDEVLVPHFQRGRAKGSKSEIREETTVVYTVRDGKVARIREYATKKEALEAAGLEE